MKYYSETLDKLFESEPALIQAEMEHLNKIEEEAEAKKKKEAAIAARKKELAKAIEEADGRLDYAYKNLEEAKGVCKAILEESNKEITKILNAATEEVKSAQKVRLEAITAFNKEFGAFRTTYSGERAQKEFDRTLDLFSEMFKPFFRF